MEYSSQESNAANVSILFTEKKIIFYVLCRNEIICVLLSNRRYVKYMFLDVLSSFIYVEITMKFMRNDAWMKIMIWIVIWEVWLPVVVGIEITQILIDELMC
jgi:hypothetical protein